MMKYLGIFVVILWSATHEAFGNRAHLKPSRRIIAGNEATEGQFPWQVAVGNPAAFGEHAVCGGSLIHPEWVLTAAHCVPGVTYFRLVFGAVDRSKMDDPGIVEVNSTNYIAHKEYNSTYLENDITLIKLPSPITETDTESSDILYYVNLKTISNDNCARDYGSQIVDSLKLCAVGEGTQNACTGDSGGPLVDYDESGTATQIGIVDFVDADGCGAGEPSGYTRTEAYLDWITENTGVKFN